MVLLKNFTEICKGRQEEQYMAQINVTNLTFHYEGSMDNVFEDVSFSIDTNWKLGFIGRNGKGKTTFLNLLMRKYEYQGCISTSTHFAYFPYELSEEDKKMSATQLIEQWKNDVEEWRVICELSKLGVEAEVLYRPFETLSYGEQTKVMLATLFSSENDFLLIDEPTNHLDHTSRECVKEYISSKKGFILVSHDRDLLDACIDHVLVLNKCTIEVQAGNFSSWWENKLRKDTFVKMENEKHLKEIVKLKATVERTDRWAQKNESTKIGYDPIKEHDRYKNTRAYIGGKTKKMQARVSAYEKRLSHEIREKEGLLQDIEKCVELKVMPLEHYKNTLIRTDMYGLKYADAKEWLFQDVRIQINQGERVFFTGANGCGKSSLIKAILMHVQDKIKDQTETKAGGKNKVNRREKENQGEHLLEKGLMETASGIIISYVSQDTSFLKGTLREFCQDRNLEYSLFLAILHNLAIDSKQFKKTMEDFSEGQKKKVLIAASLMSPAHLYIWDEPLNYIDIFSRIQIEKLIKKMKPTMILVEHDVQFQKNIGTKVVEIGVTELVK